MDTDHDGDVRPRSSRPNTQTIPELEVYLNLLVLLLLIDRNKLDQVSMSVCLSKVSSVYVRAAKISLKITAFFNFVLSCSLASITKITSHMEKIMENFLKLIK